MSHAKSCQLRPICNAASGTHHKALITKRRQEVSTGSKPFIQVGKGRRNRAPRAVAWATAAAAAPTDSSNSAPAELHGSAARPPLSPVNPQQRRTPLVDAVQQRGDASHETPFHVPGHKRGARVPEGLARLVRPDNGSVLQYDLTEISGLDFLSSPRGVIREAQQLAAEAFGADQTWFLVNGCSVGIHAAVMAITAAATEAEVEEEDEAGNPRDSNSNGGGATNAGNRRATLIVARNCHLSAFSAMVLSGCEPYWVHPEVDSVFDVAHCATPGAIRAALYGAAEQGRRVVGVLIVSPTYFGAVADVAAIAAVCHEHGVPLLVDEAHGGHFAFLPPSSSPPLPSPLPPPPLPLSPQQQQQQQHHRHNDDQDHRLDSSPPLEQQEQSQGAVQGLPPGGANEPVGGNPCVFDLAPLAPSRATSPPSSLQCGADIAIQSTHKILGAMTQAAMLHIAGTRVSPSRIDRALQTLQSSSPSYILMASLDAARAQAAAGGAFDQPCAAAQAIRGAVSRCKRIRLLDERTAGSKASVRYFDPLRLTLLVDDLPELPGGGFGAAEWLEQQFGVVTELATAKTVVLALGPGTTMAHAATAIDAILQLDRLVSEGLEAGTATATESTSDVHVLACDHRFPPPATAGETPLPARMSAVQMEGKADAKVEVEVVLTPREAYFASTESIAAAEAVGRVSAELLCPYPPGVPVLFPGERITAAALEVLSSTLAAGGAVTGARDGTLATLTVVAKARRSQLRQRQ
ncbi:hypothetical protein Vafri_11831 [Volvox africanus]|uniref:Orn/Lys/Arg decarboxylases family 1 pyridoxal-P attachment site domain-containing protein n=1 Tax=Volvox africanus TaxID=51714 RepID=A0A8J4F4S0_9CHLO|nr:hypothetical protein Vafri_11831 [Volvox africanus]